jgi:hydrogenase expression/formation protein HypC
MCLAVPGQIVSLEPGEAPFRAGRVRFGGIVKRVHLGFVPEAGVGDYVVVHVGVAIARLDEHEAEQVFETLRELGALDEIVPAAEPSGS